MAAPATGPAASAPAATRPPAATKPPVAAKPAAATKPPVAAAQPVSSGPATTVEQTIEATLRFHKGLKTIQENREVVRHELRRAEAGWGPRVDATGRLGVGNLSDSTTRAAGGDKGMYGTSSVGLSFVQPVWDGFATRSRVRAAEATVASVDNRVFDNANTLALDSIIAHIDVIRRRELYRLAELNVKKHEEILASAADRERMGTDTLADVTQTQGRLARARSTLVDAKTALINSEDTYRRVTGLPLPGVLAPVNAPAVVYPSIGAAVDEAKKTNPKILAYSQDVKAAQGNKELADSAMHPTLNIEAGPNYSDRRGPGSNWVRSVDVAGVVRWNLFNSGADAAEIKASAARVRQTRESLYDFVDTLGLEIENTWTSWRSSLELAEHYGKAVGFNTQTLNAYLEQFIFGTRGLLDVLDAESELYNSSSQLVTAESNAVIGAYRLYALTGRLLPEMKVDLSVLDIPPEQRGASSGSGEQP